MAPRLGVNVDHVATVRQSRRAAQPDPVHAAVLAELAGADQITVHLREDRRHVQERDVEVLRRLVQTRLNLEMAATPEMLAFARRVRPDMCTLVPERREELTTEGGLDVIAHRHAVSAVVDGLREDGIVASLFVDPEPEQLRASQSAGAHVVEIHTGRYADAAPGPARARELTRIEEAARLAAALRLGVAAGHGLDYRNVGPVAAIAGMEELNIGHAIVGRAILVGMERAVSEMIDLMRRAGR